MNGGHGSYEATRMSELDEFGMCFFPSSNRRALFRSLGTRRAIGIGSGWTSSTSRSSRSAAFAGAAFSSDFVAPLAAASGSGRGATEPSAVSGENGMFSEGAGMAPPGP